KNQTISFTRKKTQVPVVFHLGKEALNILKDMPSEGPLFPYLSRVRSADRATEFKQRCRGLGIEGVSLHSYRYSWAERAKQCGYPERFAQEALGHNSAAVDRAYAKRAQVKIPALEDFERRHAAENVASPSVMKRTPTLLPAPDTHQSASQSRTSCVRNGAVKLEVQP